MCQALKAKQISVISTARDIIKRVGCDDNIRNLVMIFDEIPDEGSFFGEAFLGFTDEEDVSRWENKFFTLRGVENNQYLTRCDQEYSLYNNQIKKLMTNDSQLGSSEMNRDVKLLVTDLAANKAKALELLIYFSQFGKVSGISLHFEFSNFNRGFAIIEFSNVESKVLAIPVNGKSINHDGKLSGCDVTIGRLPADVVYEE